MKKLAIGLCLFILMVLNLSAQQRPLGTWETFLPYGSANQVVQSNDRIYCSTQYAIMYVEKADGSISTLTKSTGLSDANPRRIAYHPTKNTLIITYNNSNIDLLVNGKDIYNIPDIKNAVINGSKNINDVAIIGEYAYLATDLGISVLDLDKKEIKENYIIGDTGQSIKVNSVASDGISIYAATDEGLKSAPLSSTNLQNYANWTVYTSGSGLPHGVTPTVGQIGGRFYTVISDTLFVQQASGGMFTKLRYDSTYQYQRLSISDGNLYAMLWGNYVGKVLRIKPDGSIDDLKFPNSARPLQLVHDGSDNWIADAWNGLLKYQDTVYLSNFAASGPPSYGVFHMATAGNSLYLAAGGTDEAYIQPYYFPTGPIVFSNHQDWKGYDIRSYSEISGCYDLVDVAVDELHHKAYYGSLQGGLVEQDMNTNALMKYDTSNSTLGKYNTLPLTRVSALCLDQSQNLWMSNTGAAKTLVVKTPGANSEWASFLIPPLVAARQMVADDYGQIWIAGRASILTVYNPGTKITDPSDDQVIALTTATGNGGLPNSNVWSIVKDKNGDIWVGTDQGIATFYCAGSMFSTNGCDATLIKVNQDGFIGYLFSTEVVKALAVDGANRKWVGTTNGVWLISEDGTKQLLHFTKENSPLLSNGITSITVDEKTGEVFIGTDQGLVSYQGDAIAGGSEKGKALVYPNPVKPDYTGPIAIKGLVDNAYVKITDAAGILVYQGRANGGQMIWDGKGYNGNKVETGIYLVYADTDLGKQHNVGKIIFIN